MESRAGGLARIWSSIGDLLHLNCAALWSDLEYPQTVNSPPTVTAFSYSNASVTHGSPVDCTSAVDTDI